MRSAGNHADRNTTRFLDSTRLRDEESGREGRGEREKEKRSEPVTGGYLGDYASLHGRCARRTRLIASSSRQIDIVSLRLVAAITHIIYARERGITDR